MPKEVRSESNELWLSESLQDPQELALGLRWISNTDTLAYRYRPFDYLETTMRNIYRVLAKQYDPLGFITPYTTRAKVIVQHLRSKQHDWDDPLLPEDLLHAWHCWEEKLHHLPNISLPRCYTSPLMDHPDCVRKIHVFCDVSERAYGSVAYLRTETGQGKVEVAFLAARSRVASRREQTIPRLELCGALTEAQLASVLEKALTLKIRNITLWTDSLIVLTWLQSESCRYKVFVCTRVSAIQELTSLSSWRYVESANNPADDITRGKTLHELAEKNRWSQGPPFLWRPPEEWPMNPTSEVAVIPEELKKSTFCGGTSIATNSSIPDPKQFSNFKELIEAVAHERHGAANKQGCPSAEDHVEAEREILRQVQLDCFPEDIARLSAGRPVLSTSRLLSSAPEYDPALQLIRVGGRLRRSNQLESDVIHPIILDPSTLRY